MDAYRAAQSMNDTYRETPLPLLVAAQTFVSPEVSVMEEIPAPDMPEEINVKKRLLWFYEIKELVSNRESLTEIIRQCISWIREVLPF